MARRRLIGLEYRTRLEELKGRCELLCMLRRLGAELRGFLSEQGSPTWQAEQDHLWRSWINQHGDERARSVLAAIDQVLLEKVERARAAAPTAAGSGRQSGDD